MAEYVIVCAGLISALYFVGDMECGAGSHTTKCVTKLLGVMHDSYDGYSSSISAVQKYGDFAAKGTFTEGYGPGTGGGSNSGGGSVGGLNPDGLSEVSQVTTPDGLATYGRLLPDGSVVNQSGEVIGFYSDSDEILTLNNGSQVSVNINPVVQDEAGNILHLRAVTACTPSIVPAFPKPVYSWGYLSKASGKFFNSVNKDELDIGSLCTEPSFKVVKKGKEQGGRILNSEYYAAVFAIDVSGSPLPPAGEVIYWQELGICSVMAKGWDAEVDPDNDKDADEIYVAQLLEFNDPDKNLGEIDKIDYFNQTALYGVPKQPNDCPTMKVIAQP